MHGWGFMAATSMKLKGKRHVIAKRAILSDPSSSGWWNISRTSGEHSGSRTEETQIIGGTRAGGIRSNAAAPTGPARHLLKTTPLVSMYTALRNAHSGEGHHLSALQATSGIPQILSRSNGLPGFAPAYAGLADVQVLRAYWHVRQARPVLERVLAYALKAMELDPACGDAHCSRGRAGSRAEPKLGTGQNPVSVRAGGELQ
jgi:hypothetical protein